MRRGLLNKRRDANEKPIIDALRAVGATVEQLSLADGPDLLVGIGGRNYLLEVKMPKGLLSNGQCEWHTTWRGNCDVVRDIDGALRCVGVKVRRMG